MSLNGHLRPILRPIRRAAARASARAPSLLFAAIVRLGHWRFLRSGRTGWLPYAAMRKLHGTSRGELLRQLESRDAVEHPPRTSPIVRGIVLDPEGVAERLRRDGFAIVDDRLTMTTCDALERIARTATCTRLAGETQLSPAPFDPSDRGVVRADVPEHVLIRHPVVQDLIADPSFLRVAQLYLGCEPVQDLIAMWWSAPGEGPSSAAAQQFHFDFDRLRFVKLFVYLTDVDDRRGPHEFVAGSHNGLPQRFRADRRFTDAEVVEHFGQGKIATIGGERGTMFFADTVGLHRGSPVLSGHRLVFQLQWASSLFGAPVARYEIAQPTAAFREAAIGFPRAFERYTVPCTGN